MLDVMCIQEAPKMMHFKSLYYAHFSSPRMAGTNPILNQRRANKKPQKLGARIQKWTSNGMTNHLQDAR